MEKGSVNLAFICFALSFAAGTGYSFEPEPERPYYRFCKLPPSVTRRVVAIWTPDTTKSVTIASCPKDYPYTMYGGQWCCHISGRVDHKVQYANSKYYHCDGYSCCKNDGRSLTRCPHDRGYGCRNSANYWKVPPNYSPYHGDSKNIGTSNHGLYHYDNVNGIDLLREGDFVVLQCDNQYKAFVCEEPDANWSKDCRYQTDNLKVDEINFFLPHHLRLESARAYCRSHRGTLATIRSEVDNKIAAKIMLMRGQGNQCAFIGFTDEVNSGIWRWMNGKDVTYTNWAYHKTDKGWDQPNDGFGYGKEDYTVMCRYPNSPYKNTKNEFKWFDVGPPRNYYGNTVNFELAFSFCTSSANFEGTKKNCKRPTRPCGGAYTKKSKKGTIEHGKFHLIKCNKGYRIQGNGRISCNNGDTTPIPKCIKIRYAVYDGQGTEGVSSPRVFDDDTDDVTAGDNYKRGKKNCVGNDDGPNTDYTVIPAYDGNNGNDGNNDNNSGGDSIPRQYTG